MSLIVHFIDQRLDFSTLWKEVKTVQQAEYILKSRFELDGSQ